MSLKKTKTKTKNKTKKKKKKNLLNYLRCNVTVPLEDMGRVPQHIRGENCGLDVGKFVRETARQLRTDTGTICRWRWRDRFRSTCEVKAGVKDRPCVGRPTVTSETNGNVYAILKLQLFWCDPESIKCPELCYFIPMFSKQGIKLKLKLQRIWPNIQNYFCVFCFWTIEFVSWWGETFLSKFI